MDIRDNKPVFVDYLRGLDIDGRFAVIRADSPYHVKKADELTGYVIPYVSAKALAEIQEKVEASVKDSK